MNTQQNTKILGWAVCYVPTRQGKLFAGLKCETIATFRNQDDAIEYNNSANMGECVDEMHIGYKVYPMHWIPKGITLR